ncbi:MAG: TfoX/Sxy family protein [Planctomycetaceae bacterium]|nr:TfoX/Sxy family protein [Planctomycetaceae bacterium]
MPFDPLLADRVRVQLSGLAGLTEKKMFGGLGFLMNGHMCCGIWQESLIARVGPNSYQECLDLPGAGEFDITGRPMTGWIMVAPNGVVTDDDLANWIDRCVDFVKTLPPKD